MDENKKELNEQIEEQNELEQNEKMDETVSDVAEEKDSGFEIESVESEDALEALTSNNELDNYKSDSEEIDLEEDIQLAKYCADCDTCATRVYFELDDLDEDGNLLCPNCEEIIEIDNEAIDYYLVKKEEESPSDSKYVVDCPSCEAVVHFTNDDIDDEEDIICPQCSEKIHIDTEVLDAYKEKDIEKSLKRKAKLKKILAVVCGVLLGLAVALAVIWFVGNKQVVKVDGTPVSMDIYKCVYYCENAINYTGSGLDLSKPASKQPYENGDEYETWDDALKDSTNSALKIYYSIYNAGQKEGFKRSKEDKKKIDETIDSIKSYANESNQTFEDYMKSNYGISITEKRFRPYLELSAYVNAYYKHCMAKGITDKDLEKIYKDNPDNFDVVSFRYFYVPISDKINKKEALKRVKAVAAAKDEKQFHKLAKKYATEDVAKTYTDDKATLVEDMACSNIVDRPVSKFLTDKNSKKGTSSYGVSSDSTYAEAAMLVTPRHKDESLIKEQAITEAATKKGEKFISDISDKAQVKSGLGMLIRNIVF